MLYLLSATLSIVKTKPMRFILFVSFFWLFNVSGKPSGQSNLPEKPPGFESGGLATELQPGYGLAALMEVPGMHKRVSKKGF